MCDSCEELKKKVDRLEFKLNLLRDALSWIYPAEKSFKMFACLHDFSPEELDALEKGLFKLSSDKNSNKEDLLNLLNTVLTPSHLLLSEELMKSFRSVGMYEKFCKMIIDEN